MGEGLLYLQRDDIMKGGR